MKAWLKVNESAFEDDFEVCTMVWSHMTGPSTGCYEKTHMAKCYESESYPDMDALIVKVQAFFSP